MKIESSQFAPGSFIPMKYTCDGSAVNPPLSWSGVPEGAKSLALIMDDPDAPRGTWDHWLVWNIPPDMAGIAENSVPRGVEGKNSGGTDGYAPPCPPDREHRYFFRLYALDSTLDLPAGSEKPAVLRAMHDHILAEAELYGVYDRRKKR